MEKEFLPYAQALALKGLGFDEPCMCFQYNKDSIVRFVNMSDSKFDNLLTYHRISTNPTLIWNDTEVIIPTFSQAFRWFREKYHIIGEVKFKGGKTTKTAWYDYVIYSEIDWNDENPNEQWKKHEEAELECLKKLIEIVKEK